MERKIVEKDLIEIKNLVNKVLNYDKDYILERMGGLTNHTYKVKLDDNSSYVVRIPGDGTEEMINRKDEKVSTLLACELGIDEQVLYFDEKGNKVTKFINNAVTLNKDLMAQENIIDKVADIFHKLHTCNVDTKVPFEVFDMAMEYENIMIENYVKFYDDYSEVKNCIDNIKKEIDTMFVINKTPCHNDPLCENWVLSNDKLYLIDWEYAGMNDPLWDLADVSIEADFDNLQDIYFLEKYYNRKVNQYDIKHLYANKIYVDYLWTLWALTRVPFDGKPMQDWADSRYDRLKKNIKIYYNK